MNKLLYISTGIPESEANRLREKQFDFSSNALLPISVFHGNILSGLAESYDEVTALDGVPISRHNFNIRYYKKKKIKNGKVQHIIPGFFNLPMLKQLIVITKFWWYIMVWGIKNRKHNRHIIIDGTFYTGLISLWLASMFVKAKKGAILVDYYSFMDPCGNKCSQKAYYGLLKCIDRFMFVTEELEKLVNRDAKNYMIMEGVVNVQQVNADATIESYCVYAGGLHEIYGVKNLVDAFHASQLPYSLYLYGNGDLIEYINEISKVDPRIAYKGIISHEELLRIEKRAKLLINPRPIHGKLDTRFNFPSKLMEYMQSGRPVITTKLLGISAEYEGKMYFFDGDTTEMIKEGLENVLEFDERVLSSFGSKAREFVNENKNNVAVGKRIFCLMNAREG